MMATNASIRYLSLSLLIVSFHALLLPRYVFGSGSIGEDVIIGITDNSTIEVVKSETPNTLQPETHPLQEEPAFKLFENEGFESRLLWSILGGVIGAVIALWLEKFQKPHLSVETGDIANSEHTYPGNYVVPGRWKFYRLRVSNTKLPIWLSWFMSREAAESLHAQITFIDIQRSMKGRWASTLELAYANNFDKIKLAQYPDPETIFVGESLNLDILAKHEHDAEAYGWNNEAYLNFWRTPLYKLDPGEYKIEVKLRGTNCEKRVLLKLYVDTLIEKTRLHEVSKW